MELIDKDKLVKEIGRVLDKLSNTSIENNREFAAVIGAQHYELISLVQYINTLEVKEVDLEKHLKEDIDDVLFDLNGVAVKGATHYLTVEDVKDIAKHFYSLGMAASNVTEED